jgi:hypothetical protein
LHEWLQQRDVAARRWTPLRVLDRNLRRGMVRFGATVGGSWHGNDTAWRMGIDISRILHYARKDGTLTPEQQRVHCMLVDGIIAGEGSGPLAPSPRPAGMLLFADSIPAGDYVCARFMGFDPDRLPIIRNAFQLRRYPLAVRPPVSVRINGRGATVHDIDDARSGTFVAPRGWLGHVELADAVPA